MSDGPHRTLPMRRAWKELSKRADKKAYELTEVREALPHALQNDWTNEVPYAFIAAVKSVFVGKDNSLRLPEIALQQLEAARTLAAGSVFATNAVSWCIEMVHTGRIDEAGMLDAIASAIKERAFTGFRQVEEHYYRESTQRRADGVRTRLEDAARGLDVHGLARQLMQPDKRPAALSKKMSVDDGVRLP